MSDPILTNGVEGAAVHELVELLRRAGTECPAPVTVTGAGPVLDAGVMAAVEAFRERAGVREPRELVRDQDPRSVIGPATWGALRLHARALAAERATARQARPKRRWWAGR